MFVLVLIVAITSDNLSGFWHSEPDLSEGYKSCYFFWDTGEYAYMRSIEEGTLYMGDWFIANDELVLHMWDAMNIGGSSMGIRSTKTTLELSTICGISRLIILSKRPFYLLNRDPSVAIISLVPTYGMTSSEIEAFSTYD
ncbi:MAG: hypothetical protein K8S24_08655 [Candidatus Aegiribacteria sp.]|nr:hypothetical protein [Candidatus Aegiribacteria sp.]